MSTQRRRVREEGREMDEEMEVGTEVDEETELERQVGEEGERFGKLYRSASNNQISYRFSI